MPCRVEQTPAELEASRQATLNKEIAKAVKPLQERNDKLSHENDQLREALLKIVGFEPKAATWIGEELLAHVEKNQVEHRKEDLRRLEVTFNENLADLYKGNNFRAGEPGWKEERNALFDMIRKVEQADPTKPLEPQLGFDPDEY